MTLGPPRQAREFYYRGSGLWPHFLFAKSRSSLPPQAPLFARNPQINQSISKCIRARRVQLQKGNALASLQPLPPSTTTFPQTTQRTSHEPHPRLLSIFKPHTSQTPNPVKMPPKSADKKPASKAPVASKAPEKKDAAGKKTAATGEKKKRTKARKETYSSYIYKGEFHFPAPSGRAFGRVIVSFHPLTHFCSPEAGPPRHWYLQPRHVHPQFLRQR